MDSKEVSFSSLSSSKLNYETEDKSRKKRSCHRRKCGHRKKSNTHITESKNKSQRTTINCFDNHISQQIHVDKQDFQCIINLNTTVCEHKSRHRKRYEQWRHSKYSGSRCEKTFKSKHSPPKFNINDRDSIVPHCFRQSCRVLQPYERTNQRINRARELYNHQRNRTYTSRKRDQYRSKHVHHHQYRRRDVYTNTTSWHENNIHDFKIFSPISSSSLKDDLSYDDISSTSLYTLIEKPLSYKHPKCCKHVQCREQQESKLDTLIRRTKERERKLVEQSRCFQRPWYASTPLHECSSSDIVYSNMDMDISLNSRSTLVLEPNRIYSPANIAESLKTEKLNAAYSPSSPIRSEEFIFLPESHDYELPNVKCEPEVDIAAYSPIQSPDNFTQSLCQYEKRAKKGIFKIEPEYPRKNPDEELKYCCTLKSIKTELAN